MIMRKEDLEPFVRLMAETADLYSRERQSTAALKIYFAALADLAFEEFRRALSDHIRACKFYPRPADLLEQARGSAEDRAAIAWQRVLTAVREIGTWESVRFPDPIIHYAVDRVGGWPRIGEITAQEAPHRERDFCGWYAKGEKSGVTWEHVSPQLPGHLALENVRTGHEAPQPIDVATRERMVGIPLRRPSEVQPVRALVVEVAGALGGGKERVA